MKVIEVKHGCYAAEVCGTLPAHTCGSPDACTDVKPNGVVCTFGTRTVTTFHEPSDIAAEVVERSAHHEKAHGGKPSPSDLAAIRVAAAQGKNIHSAEAEVESKAHGRRHGETNRAFHDASPHVFGH